MTGVRKMGENTGKIFCAVVVLAVVLASRIPEIRAASFYGTSYIHSPLQGDSYRQADIQFSFKSSRAKGLLVLLAGTRDYCIIQLKSGYIQVQLELAGVDRTIKSPVKDKLNDQHWHNVHVIITDRSMFLSIDDNFQRELSLGTSTRSLAFDDGIFVGGSGTLERTYVEQVGRFFRGCIENIQFNSVPIVNGTFLHEDVELFDVTLGCTSEFDASPDAAISFVKETAYVVFPRWQVGESGSFATWVKTSTPLGLLIYNGEAGESYVAAEIVAGHVRVILSHGVHRMDFTSNRIINDAQWHWVKISLSLVDLIISIDYEPEIMTFDESFTEPINLGGNLYVGGVVLKARSEAYESNLQSITDLSVGGSFSGCMRDVEVNSEKQTLADSRVTHGIEIGCVFEFPCFLEEPCSPGEACIETGPGSMDFLCESDYDYDEEEYDQLTTGSPGTTQSRRNKFTSTPLLIDEGEEIVINSNNIHLNLDLRALQVRESQVLFRIIKRPRHGTVMNKVLRRDNNALEFTLLDLNGNKISYAHDGSENFQDEIILTVELLGIDNIPAVFRGNPNVTLMVDITPVNDPPAVIMKPNKILRMIKNTRRTITYDFIQIVDPDNTTSEVQFISNVQGNSVGQFERVDVPGLRITSFTQDDIDQEKIVYAHSGPLLKTRVVFKVSDGLSTTELDSFRIEIFSLSLDVVNNTAARLNPRSMVPITSRHLSVTTNDPEGKLQVKYKITEDPTMGELQLKSELEGDFSWWTPAAQFTQEDINEGRVRYFATRSTIRKSLKRDWVSFTVSCLDQSIEDLEFKIEIVLTSVQVVHNTGLTLDIRRQGIIKASNLSAVVEHPLTPSPLVIYTIIRKPAKGHLLVPSYGQLIEGSNFTQIDIDVGLIGYQVDDQVYSAFNDSFLFQISVPNAQTPIMRFNISYQPDSETLIVTNRGFIVKEGGKHVISPTDLFLVAGEIRDFVYQVTKRPEHGELQLLDASESIVARHNIPSFLNFDIESGTLQYQHDDTETRDDSFAVYATASYISTNGARRTLNYTGTIDIMVEMKNDHMPERVIERPFPVIRNGKTPLTNKYLKFTDQDIDFDDANLNYQRQQIPSGDLLFAHDNKSTFIFSQRDLNEGNLMFKHTGPALKMNMVFYVYDLDRYVHTSGMLNIIASDPFISVDLNTGVKLTRGGSAAISNGNLTVETNVGVKDKKIVYTITTPPRYGVLTVDGYPSSTFTQDEISAGKVQYNHDNSSNMLDSFNFTVQAKRQQADGYFRIRVYLEGHQRLPEVERMEVLTLEEGTFAVIDKSVLKITHTNHLPNELTYHVTTPPKHGHLQIIRDLDETTNFASSEKISSFTQRDINRGNLYYVQTHAGFESDLFMFEVSTGFTRVSNLSLKIDIAPKVVPVKVKPVTILEGASKAITAETLHIAHPFYEDQLFEYYILQNPEHGLIESTRSPDIRLTQFNTQEVSNQFIYYIHDGSDTTSDSFVVIANSTDGDKESLPCVVQITIIPINDRAPEVVGTNQLEIYVGSTTVLPTASLSATDADTEAENLMYTLTTPTNGFIALKTKPGISIRNFTQANVEKGDVIFVHTGPRTGGFNFRVSDSIHVTTKQLLTIIAKPLLIEVVNNTGIKAAPGILQPITSENLKVMPVEITQTVLEEPIRFRITDGPRFGFIVRIIDNADSGTATFQTLSEFTQNDIDLGVLGYQLSVGNAATQDRFVFDVLLPLSQNIRGEEFIIEIVSPDMIETTNMVTTKPMQTTPTLSPFKIYNRGIEVREGSTVTISEDHLNAANLLNDLSDEDIDHVTLEYEITKVPSHGYLLLNQRNLTRKSKFTQNDLDNIGIRYRHDHSDDRRDRFNFTVRVRADKGSQVSDVEINPLMYKGEFVITIDPVNDQVFVVETPSLRMQVVQGYTKVITSDDLRTIDPDNLPSELTYILFGQPSNGRIALTNDPEIPVGVFTQEQIDNGDIIFVHDGGVKPEGTFVFQIKDGAHTQYKQFTIQVISVSLALHTQELVLPQGDENINFSNINLNVTTNGDRRNVRYNITTLPRLGQIVVDGNPQLSFSQQDIDDDKVQYKQDVMTMSGDLVKFTVYDKYNVLRDANITINVRPLIYLEQLNATTGRTIPITPNYINATELAVKTRSDPTFKIRFPPRRGLVLNVSSNLAISQFNYSDIQAGLVAYSADHLLLDSNITIQDAFRFEFAAAKAQPVEITFRIEIGPKSADYTTQPTTLTRLRTRGGAANGGAADSWNNTIIDFPIGDLDAFPTTDPSNEIGLVNNDPKTKKKTHEMNTIVIIIPVVIIILIIFIVLLLVLWRLNRGKEKKNTNRESAYPEPDIGPYPGAQPVPVQVGMMPPVNVTSIRPNFQQNGHIPSRVQNPMVPQVTVTALGRPPSPKIFNPVNSLVSLSSNGTATMAYQYDSSCEQCDAEYMEQCRTASPTLKKSQYWV